MATTPTPMTYRFLGRSGLKVSTLSLGGIMVYGVNEEKAKLTRDCVKAAIDLGINTFDQSEFYGTGQSEIDMGSAFKDLKIRRSDLVINTKIYWGGDGPNDIGLSRKHVIEGLQASLKRLQLDYVDVVYAHRYDPDTPMEETVRAFNYCIERGWAFYWGTSEWSAQLITEAHAVANRLNLIGPICEQPQYNCLAREKIEKEYLPLYAKYGLGTTTWSPLASGILTGKYNDGIPPDSRIGNDNIASEPIRKLMINMRQLLMSDGGKPMLENVGKLGKIAKRLGTTTALLALAWCVRNKNVSTVIIGASCPEQITENVKCLELVTKLTPEIMVEVDTIFGNKPATESNPRAFNF